MKIPQKVKVGGKTYQVEITNRLDLGNVNYSGEVNYQDLIIRICPQAQQKMEGDFLHELCHAIYNHPWDNLILNSGTEKIKHLALHAKKKRTRKKNFHRLRKRFMKLLSG